MSDNKKNNVLKGGEFLIKNSVSADVFSPENFNDEQKMIGDMTREFLNNEILPNLDKIDKQEEGLMVSLLNKAAELGLLGTAIPEEYNGFGKDFNTNTYLTDILGAGHSFPVALLAHTGIGTLPILYFGTEEQKKKYLPKLATGELKASYCLTEPGSGSDALAAKTKAVLSEDKKYYVINGQKMWITNAGFADVFIVFAKIDGEKFTGFILEKTMPGLTLGAEEHKLGIKGSSTRQVFFENVKVPVENLLGEIGKGHLIAFNILNVGRFKLCAATLGAAKKSATVAINYANERHQFGQPLSAFGAIQYKLAEQAIRLYVCESSLYRISDYINHKEHELREQGKSYNEALMGAAHEYAGECAILKVFGSEVLDYVVDETVQVHGGYGFSEEYPAARAYRDSRINRIFEGTNEINRMLLIDTLLKRAVKGELKLFEAAKGLKDEIKWLYILRAFKNAPKGSGYMGEELQAIKNAKKAILVVLGAAAQKFKEKLSEEQEIMMNCADMIINLLTAESVILRVQKLAKTGTPEEQIAKVYTRDALNRIADAGKEAIHSFAHGQTATAMEVGISKWTAISAINIKNSRRAIAKKLIEENRYCF